MAVISVAHLTKEYRCKRRRSGLGQSLKQLFSPAYFTKTAVQDLSFSVAKGEVLGFIGPNGAGKSTTIKMLSGILRPTDGHISVLGLTPQKDRLALAKRIGTVFGQKSQLWIHLPPLETFRLLARIYDVPNRLFAERLDRLTAHFELTDLLHQPVRKLSLGQRIRCEMAASLLHQPEVLFLDEPTIGLDVVVKKHIRDLIERLRKEEGTTIILTSHDIADIAKLCKRVIIINHGRLVIDMPMKQLKYNYMNRKVIALKTDAPVDLAMDGINVIKQRTYAARIEVDTGMLPLDRAIDMLMSRNSVIDITITDPPLEEVIGTIFTNGAPGA